MKHCSKAIAIIIWLLALMVLMKPLPFFSPPAHAAGPWYVGPGGGDANDCTSPATPCATINGALNKPGFVAGDTIRVAVGTYTGTGNEVVLLNKNATLSGGWNTDFTTQNGLSTIEGQSTRWGVWTSGGVTATVDRFLVQNGIGGVYNAGLLTLSNSLVRGNSGEHGGGGLNNSGTLTVNNSTIRDNVGDSFGGGIANSGTMTLNKSAVISNRTGGNGGGIGNDGTLTLINSTVSKNTAGGGGGIFQYAGTLILKNSTISGNSAPYQAGGGLQSADGVVTLQNTILAGNTANSAPDCSGSISSSGYNLLGNSAGCTFSPWIGDQTNLNPSFGVLLEGAGYLPLLPGSPAIDMGSPASPGGGGSACELTDQRGAARLGRCDVGAYEYTPPGPPVTIATVAGDAQSSPPLLPFTILLQAVVLDNLGSPVNNVAVTFTAPGSGPGGTFADTGTGITTATTNESGLATAATFTADGLTGTYPVTTTAGGVITPATFLLANRGWYVTTGGNDGNNCQAVAAPCASINGVLAKAGFSGGDTVLVASGTYRGSGAEVALLNKSVRLFGGWNGTFTTQSGASSFDGQGARRGITVNSGVTASLDRFLIQNGLAGEGGGIYNDGTLTLNNSTIKDNTASSYGGGIYNYSGLLTLNNSLISHNESTGEGGGIFNYYGTTLLNHSAVSGNIGRAFGGGINAGNGIVILNASTVNDNAALDSGAPGFGGGIYSYGIVTLNNSTVSGNTAAATGGIYHTNGGALNINSSTVVRNNAGGLFFGYGSATIRNSIIAENGGYTGSPDCAGDNPITSAGYNLIENLSGCPFSPGPGDLSNLKPGLGQLVNNPGYHPLLANSPAVNTGNPAGCKDHQGNLLPTDQRGANRVGRCDIGAYEYTSPGPPAKVMVVAGAPQRAAPLSVFDTPFRVLVLDNAGTPLNNITVTFSAPLNGASGKFTSNNSPKATAVTDGDGLTTAAPFRANGVVGGYTVTATVAGAASPALFALENILPWYVALGGNNNNSCQAPAAPCATVKGVLGKAAFVPGDTVLVTAGTYTGSGDEVVLLNKTVHLIGGWNNSFTAQPGLTVLDGQKIRRGLTVNTGVTATVERFTVQNGSASFFQINIVGGGIGNLGTLTLKHSQVLKNVSKMDGGGIYNCHSLTLDHTTVSGNTATEGVGGGILNYSYGDCPGNVTLNYSTVSGNTADVSGGGISSSGPLTLNNSTLSGNIVTNVASPRMMSHGGGISSYGLTRLNNSTITGNNAQKGLGSSQGGGLHAPVGPTLVQNSIIAGNIAANGSPDCKGALTSAGYNLIGNSAGCTFTPASGDLLNLKPKLGPLEGSPAYHPLLVGSPAFNAGNPAGCLGSAGLLATDQRGFPRFGRCDIGTYELQPIAFSTKAASLTTVEPGDVVTYTIKLTNGGATLLGSARMTDTLPPGLSYLHDSLSATNGSYSFNNGLISWSGSISAGGNTTISFRAKVEPVLAAIANTVVISAGGEIIRRTATLEVKSELCNLTKQPGSPVLSTGPNGAWDDEDVWRPAVLKVDSGYKMWYIADDGTHPSRIGLATSADGLSWSRYGGNPVLSPGQGWEAGGLGGASVIYNNGQYQMWYTGFDSNQAGRIGYATSADGVTWTKYAGNPVLNLGAGGSWEDAAVFFPSVLKEGNLYHLWYEGNDGSGQGTRRIGHATSPDGLTWSKDPANPVLDIGPSGGWDWLNAYGPSVIKVGSHYLLWYSGQTLPQAWQTGYALSPDGVKWSRQKLLLPEGAPGAFDSGSADYVSVIAEGGRLRLWYSGLDQNDTYRIGHATAQVCGTVFPTTSQVYLPLVLKGAAACPAYYTETFADPESGWSAGDDNRHRLGYTEGQYQIWLKASRTGWFVTPGAKAVDFTASVSAHRVKGDSGGYGLIFGLNSDWTEWYEFDLGPRSFSVWKFHHGDYELLYPWSISPHIKAGAEWNRLKVIRSGTMISLYANDQPLATFQDITFTGLRRIGLTAYSEATANEVRFDNFALYPASCGVQAAKADFEMGKAETFEKPALPGLE